MSQSRNRKRISGRSFYCISKRKKHISSAWRFFRFLRHCLFFVINYSKFFQKFVFGSAGCFCLLFVFLEFLLLKYLAYLKLKRKINFLNLVLHILLLLKNLKTFFLVIPVPIRA